MIANNTVKSDTVEIDAPIELVWAVLVDFNNYDKWNTFCPQLRNAALEVGAAVEMMVDLGHGPQQQVEYITLIEPGRAIAWGMENKPGDPIHAVRTQYLTPLGPLRCSYISIDEFSGEAAAAMLELMGKAVENGFNRCAYDLKKVTEARHRCGE